MFPMFTFKLLVNEITSLQFETKKQNETNYLIGADEYHTQIVSFSDG